MDLIALAQETAAHARQHGLSEASSSFIFNSHEDGVMATATVTVTITEPHPVLADDPATTPANTPVDIDVLANDSDPLGRSLMIVAVQSPTALGGSAVAINNGTRIRYTPPVNVFDKEDVFTYEARAV